MKRLDERARSVDRLSKDDDEATDVSCDAGCQWLSMTVDGKVTITKLILTSIAITDEEL